jgi:hypothetical protein
MKEVAPAPVWYGIWLAIPPAMLVAVVADVAVLAFPLKEAVIVPALKFPDASLATIALAVLALVAVVALLDTFPAVAIVAKYVSVIAVAFHVPTVSVPTPVIPV